MDTSLGGNDALVSCLAVFFAGTFNFFFEMKKKTQVCVFVFVPCQALDGTSSSSHDWSSEDYDF